MPDSVYCYPNSDTLKNKLNIRNERDLFNAEKELSFIRLQELQNNPIEGEFDFKHLKQIHEYIFQDIYDWAGKTRTVEIGKGNLFCTTSCINDYAKAVFDRFFSECDANKLSHADFIKVLAENYGDLNALHPFREGNGRTQREFTRLVCLKCGYVFDLSSTTHKEMLAASQLSFNTGDSSGLRTIFEKTVIPIDQYSSDIEGFLQILSSDDLSIEDYSYTYDYYSADENVDKIKQYDEMYQRKILQTTSIFLSKR